MNGRIVAVVPAFDEEAAIGAVVAEIQAFDPAIDVVVVDDGSATRPRGGRGGRAAVVRLPFNLGHRRRRADGFRYALEQDYDVAVRLDGDGQHDPCRSCSSRSSATRRTSSPARASARARTATGRRSGGASGSRGSPASSRCSRGSA